MQFGLRNLAKLFNALRLALNTDKYIDMRVQQLFNKKKKIVLIVPRNFIALYNLQTLSDYLEKILKFERPGQTYIVFV